VKVEVSAEEDEGAERAQVESATPSAPEPIGGDELVALPPLDARRSRRTPCPGKDVRQARAEIEGARQVDDEGVIERRDRRCFDRLSERGHCARTVACRSLRVIPALHPVAGRRAGESTVVLAALRGAVRSATVRT
jgi:hypothetical protein